MLKKGVAKEKLEVSSKEFTKKFIKNFILNGLIIGIVIAIINELVGHFITNNIIKEILYFSLIFFAINNIHVAAIKDTFYDSYILGENIRKAKNNVMILFIAIALGDIIWNAMSLTRLYTVFGSLGSLYLKSFIVKSIISILLYAIIIVFCRDEIDKECSEYYSDNKNYLTKKVILIIVFAIAGIVGTIFINQPNKSAIPNDKSDKVTSTDKQDTNLQQSNEMNLQALNESSEKYPFFIAKSNDGKVEFKLSSFPTKISEDEEYMNEEVSDGILVFYTVAENNYVEKLDMQGNSKWKTTTIDKIDECIEVTDGYFMKGEQNAYRDFILKVDMNGNIISTKFLVDENQNVMSNVILIESEKDNKNGCAKIIGRTSVGKNVIISFDNNGNQENISDTNLRNVACEKVIEKNGYYYGIGADSTVMPPHTRRDELVFKLDNNGNEIFKYNIVQDNRFSGYVDTDSWISDIDVNNEYIFISVTNDIQDVLALDLDGNIKSKVGYSTNNKLNNGYDDITIGQIKATDDGVYVLGSIYMKSDKLFESNSQKFIDKISNNFNLEYRFNIPDPEKFGLRTTIYFGNLTETAYTDADMYDDYSMVLHQYKLD